MRNLLKGTIGVLALLFLLLSSLGCSDGDNAKASTTNSGNNNQNTQNSPLPLQQFDLAGTSQQIPIEGIYRFAVIQWIRGESEWLYSTVSENLGQLRVGTQFELAVFDSRVGEQSIGTIPIKAVKSLSFWQDGVPYSPESVGLTTNQDPFYRIDCYNAECVYNIHGQILLNGKWYGVSGNYRVITP